MALFFFLLLLSYSNEMRKIITHNGSFHADDVFAVATLQLHFGPENVEVIRTRNETVIATGDVVADVGGIYDPAHERFDHHQKDGPVRENGIPYAAFGLVWKHSGEAVAGSAEAATVIETELVLPIDAADNGVEVFDLKNPDVSPAVLQYAIGLMKPVWNGTEDMDVRFLAAVDLARGVLERAVMHAKAGIEERAAADQLYESSDDKRVLVAEVPISPGLFVDHPEVLFVVFPDENSRWHAVAVRKSHDSFATKASFPDAWRALRDQELARASGIPDAVFCHKAGFLFVAGSREGALAAVDEVVGG